MSVYTNFLYEMELCLSDLGVREGDSLYVASDTTRLLVEMKRQYGISNGKQRNNFLSALVEKLQEQVGRQGNLLFPVFSWEFCRGKGFNRSSSLGEVGALNNWILKNRKDFRRTRHPLYSFMVWGKNADDFVASENVDAWGADSLFAWLHHHGGKMLLLDVSLQRGFTFMHYVEESVRVPYRYFKNFRGEYTDIDGTKSIRSYTMDVRDLAISSQEYLPDSFLEEKGAMRGQRCGNLMLKVIDLPKAYDAVSEDLRRCNGAHCYRFENYVIDWNRGATHADDLGN